jgi:hypothetical protein
MTCQITCIYTSQMVTGYILQALGIYESNTGDKRYHEKDCLEFVVTDNKRYKADIRAIADAVFENMEYTLYPCEPNWLYTPCKYDVLSHLKQDLLT